jgi:hypothetical protein
MQNSERLLKSNIFHSLVWFNVTPTMTAEPALCISFKVYIESAGNKKNLHYVDFSDDIDVILKNLTNMFKISINMDSDYTPNYELGIQNVELWHQKNKSLSLSDAEVFGFNRMN